MLLLAAIGGFFIPIIFGHLVSRTSFDTGWVFLAITSFTFALVGLAGHNPASAAERPDGGVPAPAQLTATEPHAGVNEDAVPHPARLPEPSPPGSPQAPGLRSVP
jgi:hypothetical protein